MVPGIFPEMLISKMGVKRKLRMIKKKYGAYLAVLFPIKAFYGLQISQRQPACLEVNISIRKFLNPVS